MSADDGAIFRALLLSSTDNIFVIDRDLRVTHVSRGGAQALGFTPDELIGKTWREVGLGGDTLDQVESRFHELLDSGE